MKHTVLILSVAALVASLSVASLAFEINLDELNHIKVIPPACSNAQCCEAEQGYTAHCRKPICPHCHGSACMVICEMKKVKKTVWVVECEKFAPVNPSCNFFDVLKSKLISGKKSGGCEPEGCCEKGCCGEGCCKACTPPQCGRVRCKKKLVKKEITCEVPVYKCVVTGCRACCSDGCGESKPAPVENPAPFPEAPPNVSAQRLPVAPARTMSPPILMQEKKEVPQTSKLRVPVFEFY
ncbi:MAG: hypothetical protein PVH19_13040 [Planctomycetia bacterium]